MIGTRPLPGHKNLLLTGGGQQAVFNQKHENPGVDGRSGALPFLWQGNQPVVLCADSPQGARAGLSARQVSGSDRPRRSWLHCLAALSGAAAWQQPPPVLGRLPRRWSNESTRLSPKCPYGAASSERAGGGRIFRGSPVRSRWEGQAVGDSTSGKPVLCQARGKKLRCFFV